MIVKQFKVGPLGNFTYLLVDDISKKGAIIDPTLYPKALSDGIEELGANIELILNTHHHLDHTAGNQEARSATGAKLAGFGQLQNGIDLSLANGQVLELGKSKIEVIHTPGHTPDSVCFLVGDSLFTGDTLFVGECGRTDLPGGSAQQLWDTFFRILEPLSDELKIYPGHDYGSSPVSTLGEERQSNYTLQPRSMDDFVKFMESS